MIQPIGMIDLLPSSPRPDINGNSCWTNSNVDGVRLQLTWAENEPSEGSYYWVSHPGTTDFNHGGNDIDAALYEAYTAGKFIGLSIQAGNTSPHWIYDTYNVYKFNLDPSDTVTSGDLFMPLIWDTIYQSKFNSFVTALASHINSSPYKSALRYVVVSGIGAGIDMQTFCQNIDGSKQYTGATLTDTGLGYTKIDCPSALFLTESGSSSIIGKAIQNTAGFTQNLPSAAVVKGLSAGMPADPTETTVYVNKPCATGPGTYTSQHIDVLSWLTNLGEFYRMDQISLSPPGGYAGLAGTTNANGVSGSLGNYVIAAKLIIGWFISLFPNTVVMLTTSAPYNNTQGATDLSTIRSYNLATYSTSQYGEMKINISATCPPHLSNVTFVSNPKGNQALAPSTDSGIYGLNVCRCKSPSPLEDLLGSFFEHSSKFFEVYDSDCILAKPSTGDPYSAAIAARYRAMTKFYNPQLEDRGNIVFTGKNDVVATTNLACLNSIGGSIHPDILTDANVDTITLGALWSAVQPIDSNNLSDCDFSYLANTSHTGVIQVAAAAGKTIILGILTQGGFAAMGGNTPNWMAPLLGTVASAPTEVPGNTFLTDTGLVFCVYYNSIFNAKKIRLFQLLAQFFTSGILTTAEQQAVKIVRVNCFNSVTEDWNVPHSTTEKPKWTSTHGYTTQKMYDVAIKSDNTGLMDTVMLGFPNQAIAMPMGQNGSGTGALDYAQAQIWGGDYADENNALGYKIADDMNAKYPGRFIGAINLLSIHVATNKSDMLQRLVNKGKMTGGQAVWHVHNDPTYRMCNPNGTNEDPLNPGVFLTEDQILELTFSRCQPYINTYIEIYLIDFEGLPTAIAYGYNLYHGL